MTRWTVLLWIQKVLQWANSTENLIRSRHLFSCIATYKWWRIVNTSFISAHAWWIVWWSDNLYIARWPWNGRTVSFQPLFEKHATQLQRETLQRNGSVAMDRLTLYGLNLWTRSVGGFTSPIWSNMLVSLPEAKIYQECLSGTRWQQDTLPEQWGTNQTACNNVYAGESLLQRIIFQQNIKHRQSTFKLIIEISEVAIDSILLTLASDCF